MPYEAGSSPSGGPCHRGDHRIACLAHHHRAGDADGGAVYRHRHGGCAGHPRYRRRRCHRHGGLAGGQHLFCPGHRIFVHDRPGLRCRGSGKRPKNGLSSGFCSTGSRSCEHADAPVPQPENPCMDAGGRKHSAAGRHLFLHSLFAYAPPGGHRYFRHPSAGGR